MARSQLRIVCEYLYSEWPAVCRHHCQKHSAREQSHTDASASTAMCTAKRTNPLDIVVVFSVVVDVIAACTVFIVVDVYVAVAAVILAASY